MLFLSFLASLSPFAFSRPMYIFVGPVTHYSCRLSQQAFLLFILSILCDPHHWALPFAGLPQIALNSFHIIYIQSSANLFLLETRLTECTWAFGCGHFYTWLTKGIWLLMLLLSLLNIVQYSSLV